MSDERAAPVTHPQRSVAAPHHPLMHCPYCGEEDLRPHEDSSGAWACRSCTRVFSVRFLGLLARGVAR